MTQNVAIAISLAAAVFVRFSFDAASMPAALALIGACILLGFTLWLDRDHSTDLDSMKQRQDALDAEMKSLRSAMSLKQTR